MHIEDARKIRVGYEERIWDLIKEFESETGRRVYDVRGRISSRRNEEGEHNVVGIIIELSP